jgi:dTDP-4-dehydrorhamnose reductase
LTSAQWDITDSASADHHIGPGDVVVNCAAVAAVDRAEQDPERAYAVNADGPGHLARTCARVGARLIHLSTDYVFSGRFAGPPRPYEIDDEPDPINVYGRSKVAGERAVHDALPAAQVVRTSWVYAGTGNDFVATMIRRAAGTDSVDVVADQVASPTYVGDLVDALLEVASGALAAPLLHVCNRGAVSRFEQAKAVFEDLGADPGRVRPVNSDRHPRPAPRPMYSALSGLRSEAAGLPPLRGWRDALAAVLAEVG